MKIISSDNFNRESVADELIAENVNEFMGNHIVNLLNESLHKNSTDLFRLVEDHHVLWRGMEELV